MEQRLKSTVLGGGLVPFLRSMCKASQRMFHLRLRENSEGYARRLDLLHSIQHDVRQADLTFPMAHLDEETVTLPLEINNPMMLTDGIAVQSGTYPTYTVGHGSRGGVLQMGSLLFQGSFNHIYEGRWNDIDAVIKTPIIIPNTLDLIMEAVIHALVSRSKTLRPYFIRMLGALRLPLDTWPGAQFVVVQVRHPGCTLDDYLVNNNVNSAEVFSILQQLAFILHEAQRHFRFMHRDLKTNNIMVVNTNEPLPEMTDEDAALLGRPATLKCGDTTFETNGTSLQLMDMGASLIHIEGDKDAFCIPICQDDTTFNPCSDLAMFCLTTLADHAQELQQSAPEALAFLREVCQPLKQTIQDLRERFIEDRYRNTGQMEVAGEFGDDEIVGSNCYEITQACKDPNFLPANFVALLEQRKAQVLKDTQTSL